MPCVATCDTSASGRCPNWLRLSQPYVIFVGFLRRQSIDVQRTERVAARQVFCERLGEEVKFGLVVDVVEVEVEEVKDM